MRRKLKKRSKVNYPWICTLCDKTHSEENKLYKLKLNNNYKVICDWCIRAIIRGNKKDG
ncbi:hypothetical protein LCGC14_2981310 [marine sediment metagenome]|uniref:Uncharacterized protein n=1 Tax=marine sediment metagenome TaxID=412755 RepID=A0A0F8X6F7_9ZZZZ